MLIVCEITKKLLENALNETLKVERVLSGYKYTFLKSEETPEEDSILLLLDEHIAFQNAFMSILQVDSKLSSAIKSSLKLS